MIVLDNLLLNFEDNFTLNASLEIPTGHFCALIGPSGAGKTTILNAIAGFHPHGSGTILLDGQDMVAISPAARPVSMLFQEHNLFAHLTLAQNVGLGLEPSLKLDASDWNHVEEALIATGLEGLGKRLPREISGGQRQRTGLARVLLRKRPVLLLDEPFAALGPALKAEMLQLVKQLATDLKLTTIMVTHDPRDAQIASDMTAFIAEGCVQQAGLTQDVFARPGPPLRSYLGIN